MFPSIPYNSFMYVINHYNICATKKQSSTTVLYTKKTIKVVTLLHSLGAINNFIVINQLQKKNNLPLRYIRFSVTFYKSIPYFKNIRLLTRPSKMYPITLPILRIMMKCAGESVIVLTTSKGLITGDEALRSSTSGLILFTLN